MLCTASSTVDEFCWQHDFHAVAKFSTEFGTKFQLKVSLFLEVPEFPDETE